MIDDDYSLTYETIYELDMPMRPDCPECGTQLAGWIAHNCTTCPNCGAVVTVKWDDNRLVVVR